VGETEARPVKVPNLSVRWTARRRRLRVPSALRAPAASYLMARADLDGGNYHALINDALLAYIQQHSVVEVVRGKLSERNLPHLSLGVVYLGARPDAA